MPRDHGPRNTHPAAPAATVRTPDGPGTVADMWPAGDLDRHLEQLADASLTRTRLPKEYQEGLRRLAADAAGRGTPLRFLVAAYLSSAGHVWTDLSDAPPTEAPHDLKEVASALIKAIGDATTALTEGYETAHRTAVRDEEAMRRECVDDLLDGRSDLGRIAERAERCRLRLVGPHTVAVARADKSFEAGDDDTHYAEEALTARFRTQDVLITTKDGLLVCVSPSVVTAVPEILATEARRATDESCRTAVSRPRPGPGGIARCYREARDTLDLAELLGRTTPIVHARDLLVFQVLGRDRAAITDLVATVLGGLEGARSGPKTLLETLTAYFACRCLNTTTARRLRVSVRTVSYRLTRIRQLTGHDPTDPDQRYILQTAVLGARLLDWPSRSLQPSE